MQGDYSRFTFDQRKHYNGVLVQQGRVQLDADANEQGAIQAYRDRTEATDTIGPCGAPKAEGGFRVVPLGPGEVDLGITAGRMYVDGLLCEVGGAPIPIRANPAGNRVELTTLDADGRALAVGDWMELSSRTRSAGFFKVTAVDPGTRRLTLGADASAYTTAEGAVARRAVTYTTQPDYPGAPALTPGAGDRLLLYLDVWERHVTAVEDPAIREVALGGPDTTARVQTVCQVRFHTAKVPDALGCADPVQGWPPAASGGRLSATDVTPPPSLDPCRVAPEGGFRGLENRLYRVEIHQPGDLDAATFKWSRDNGAVVFAVDEVLNAGARVRLRRLGRDDALTLHDKDWVEVLDDDVELSGKPGVMARVSNLDQLRRSLTLTPAVPGLDPKRHARLRRWDVPTSNLEGDIPVGSTPIELEDDGIQIRLSGGNFQTGDWWTIPARTLTGKAGPLSDAPPQGITHHYCRLALVKWGQAGNQLQATATDCRPKFPPLTAIEATDVSYDDRMCSLSQDAQVLAAALGRPVADGPVDNVQEALDVLCARDATYQQLAYVAGDGQEGSPGTLLPVRPTVVVRNAIGEPVPNATVTFTPDGQGSVAAATATTGATGEAGVAWTLGPTAGLNQLVAELRPPQGGRQQVRFNARGVTPATGGGLCSITVGDGVRTQGQFTGPGGLQAAVDAAIAAGGATICVLPGTYQLTEPIRVDQAKNLTIHGSRLETVVRANSIMPFRFSGCTDVELSDMQVTGTEIESQTDPDGLVSFRDCNGVTVQRCRFLGVSVRRPDQPDSACVLLDGCRDAVVVQECDLTLLARGRLGGIALRRTERAQLRRNTIRVLAAGGRFGVDLDDGCVGCLVVDNDIEALQPDETQNIEGAAGGVHVGSACHDAVVRGNRIGGGFGLGVALGSVGGDGGSLGGINGLEIDGNTITRMAAGGVGLLGWRRSPAAPVTDRLALRGNRIEACSYGPASVLVTTGPGGPVGGVRLAGAVVLWMGEGMRLLDNDVVDNGQLGTLKPPHSVPGIVAFSPGAGLTVAHNRVRNNVSGNPSAPPFPAVVGGIIFGSGSTFDEDGPVATVRANEVVAPVGRALLLIGNGRVGNIQVTDNHLSGEGSDPIVQVRHVGGGTVQFSDNYVISHPAEADRAVEIIARHVTFDGNHCVCPITFARVEHVLVQASGSVSATGNHVLERDRQPRPSLHLTNTSGANNTLAAATNLTTSGVTLDQPGVDVGNLAGILA
jgi:hypothetical protein